MNSQKIRIQDSQSKKEPENSVFSDFESKYSTFTQLFFKCCTAITQLFTALEIQLSNTAQHTAQHFLYCAVLWGTRYHSAAHCLHKGGDRGYLHERFSVALGWQKSRGGRTNIEKKNRKFGQQLKLIVLTKGSEQGKVFIHPEYQGEEVSFSDKRNVYMPNDIAIIELHREVKFPKHADAGQCWHVMPSFSYLHKIY